MTQPVLAEALHHLVSGIVDNPADVRVDAVTTQRGETLEVQVNPADLGRVIGRGGRTVQALRTVINALSQAERVRVEIIDNDDEPLAE